MAKLLDLPNELIAAICHENPQNIPNLRLSCGRMNVSTFDIFVRHYFTTVNVLADKCSIDILVDIASDPRFASQITTLGVCRYAPKSDTDRFRVIGKAQVFDKILAAALRLLPNCRELVLSDSCARALGRLTRHHPDESLTDVMYVKEGSPTIGLLWHALRAVKLSDCNITKITGGAEINGVYWARMMGNYSCAQLQLPTIKEFSGALDHFNRYIEENESLRLERPHVCGAKIDNLLSSDHSALRSLFNHMPNLCVLDFNCTRRPAKDQLPVILPPQLRTLTLRTGYTEPLVFSGLGCKENGLRRLVHLKNLTWSTQWCVKSSFADLLDELSYLPCLETLRIQWYTLERDIPGTSRMMFLPLTTDIPCLSSGCVNKEYCDNVFEWYSTDPQNDISSWKEVMHDKRLRPEIVKAITFRGQPYGSSLETYDASDDDYQDDFSDSLEYGLLELEDVWDEEGDVDFDFGF